MNVASPANMCKWLYISTGGDKRKNQLVRYIILCNTLLSKTI